MIYDFVEEFAEMFEHYICLLKDFYSRHIFHFILLLLVIVCVPLFTISAILHILVLRLLGKETE